MTHTHFSRALAGRARLSRASLAGAALLVAVVAFFVGHPQSVTAAPPTAFASGSLIIPMDTNTTGNHAAYNQDLGMWKAYGLVYKLLQNDIPVAWAIDQTKLTTAATDFTATANDKRTSTVLGSYAYSGGPFVIDSAHVAEALPIIQAWWAANGNQPNVHQATAGFNAEVRVQLSSAPRIANEAINGGITMAYYNAAGIPDENGNPWSFTSPGVLTGLAIANGALFEQGGACLQRKYDIFVTPHNSGYAYSLTDTNNLGTRTYSQLDTFVEQGGGWTALCHSILSNENNISDLTLNGSPAVKAMFRTSQPGGEPGGFLTMTGFPAIDNTGGTWAVAPTRVGLPVAQVGSTSVAQALPGGSVQTWPSSGPTAPQYWSQTERVASFTAGASHDHIIAGSYHDATGAGKVTYIGGHSFATTLPFATNFEGPYLRAFFNSIFFNGNAVAKVDLGLSSTEYPQNGSGPVSVSITNTGGTTAKNVTGVSLVLEPGFTYLATTFGPAPTQVGQTLTWPVGLGDIPGGATAVTISVMVDGSISGTVGTKALGQLTAIYGDDYGEGFKLNICRDIEIVPVPAPSLTKTPETQGPVTTGSNVSWTLTYGNPGGSQLQNAVVQDTLPAGFQYVSATPAPSLVIPGAQTVLRWNIGNVNSNTPTAGSITVTARAGAITAGTGTPPQQTFTNTASLSGKDVSDITYSVTDTAEVVVQALDITLGKTVNNTFISSLPGSVTYTLTPRSSSSDPLSNVRVIDPYPTGLTAPPPAPGQGGTYGAYTPIAAVGGNDGAGLTTAMTVSGNFFAQGGSVTVTLNVKKTTAGNVANVAPTDLAVTGGGATCTGPTPASDTILGGAGGAAGKNFVWTCTLDDLGEYVFGAGADDGGTNEWPEATSASVLSAPGGGPNVVTWNLGSTTPGVPGSTITGGYTAGLYGFRGNGTTTFQKHETGTNSWSAKANALANVKEGGALTNNGAGTLYALRGNKQQSFYSYDIATNAWTARANTGTNVDKGGAAVFLNVGGTNYVFATMGNGKVFKRYDIGANTWSARASLAENVKDGGALTTDGTYIYALAGNVGAGKKRLFYRYDPGADTWSSLANTPADVGWGGSLTRIGAYIYAFEGNNKKLFWRYDIGANTWSALTSAPGNVQAGGSLTTDGTNIFAFQGKTTTLWRYNVAANTWSTLAAFTAATDQGGALVFDAGLAPQGRFTTLTASRSLGVTGDTVNVTLSAAADPAVSNVTSGTLTTTPTGGASCSSLTGPVLTSADDDTSGAGDLVTWRWICTLAAGANPGSLTFSVASVSGGGGPVSFPNASSNSVLVSPLLTFTAGVPDADPNPIVDQALMIASGQATSSPPVSTFVASPILSVVKSNAPDQNVTLLPGDTITYTVVVENLGTGTATNVTVSDLVPSFTTYISCSGGISPCSESGGTVTWSVGSIAAGDNATVSFTVSAGTTVPAPPVSDTPHTIANVATATSTETPIPVPSNTVTNELQVRPTIVKSVDKLEAASGETLTYTLTVSNPGAAFTADVTDVVPAGTTFTPGPGACTPGCSFASGTVMWNGALISPGTSTFTFSVAVAAPGGSTITNAGTLDPTSPDLDAIPSNPVETKIGPTLEIVKSNDPVGRVLDGDTITYTLAVNNESDVAATSTVVTDAVPAGTSYVVASCVGGTSCSEAGGTVTWDLGTVAAGATVTLTFQVTVDPPPFATYQIENRAQVTAGNTSETGFSNWVYNPIPDLSLTKSALPTTYDQVGEEIAYEYVVTNSSDAASLEGPITVADDKATVTCPNVNTVGDLDGFLDPGEQITCTATHTITQDDLDNGSLTNTAKATSFDGTESNVAQATVTAGQLAAVSIDKDSNATGSNVLNDVITYSYAVENTGTVTITGFTVTDPHSGLSAIVCAPVAQGGSLLPGATTACTATYTVTQADINAGQIANTGTVDGTTATAGPVSDSDPYTTDVAQTASVSIDKDSNATGSNVLNDVITYSYAVENTGTVTITGFTVTDPHSGLSAIVCAPVAQGGSLLPGATTACTATYTVTQADINAGQIANTGTVDGTTATAGPVSDSDPYTTDVAQTASVSIDKDSNATGSNVLNDVITYSYAVENTGTVTITGFTVTDPHSGLSAIVCAPVAQGGSLLPGATTACTATYTVTQADINAGQIANTGTVDGTTATAGPVSDSDPYTTDVAQTASVSIDKDSNATGSNVLNDVITYSYAVENTGTVTITGFTVTDPHSGLSAIVCAPVAQGGSLLPGATTACTATYTVTQADINAGQIANTGTVDGTTATAGPVSDSDPYTTDVAQTASVSIDKDSNATGSNVLNDVITYSYAVENTGTVTITGFTVTDPHSGLSAIVCAPVAQGGSLLPGATTACTATYTVTQADINAGQIANTGTVDGTTATAGPVSDSDPYTTDVAQTASVSIDKDSNATGSNVLNDVITYSYAVENTGTVTITGFTVTDPHSGLSAIVCAPVAQGGSLLPGATTACTATYTVTQADINAGQIANTGTVDGTTATAGPVSDSDPYTTDVAQTASVSIDKDSNATGSNVLNDVITYSYAVENTGTVTITGFTVTDPHSGLSAIVCAPVAQGGSLLPGATTACTATYTVTQADINAGQIANTGTVDGTTATAGPVSDSDPYTTDVAQTASVSIDKDSNATGSNVLNDVITYSYAVENTGTVTITGFTVTDPHSGLSAIVCAPVAQGGSLLPGATTACTATYTVTQADINAGQIANTGTVDGTTATAGPVSDSDPYTTDVAQTASVSIDKDSNATGSNVLNDVITYSYAVENTGTVTITGFTVTDPHSGLSAIVCAPVAQGGSLLPGATTACTATYTVTQADINAGQIANTGTVDGTTATAGPVSDSDPYTTDVAQTTTLLLDKQTTTASYNAVGQSISYTYEITNNGTVTLIGALAVADDKIVLPATVSCPVPTVILLPGESVTCTATYTVSQQDIDNGSVTNIASATVGAATSNTDTVTVPAVQDPKLTPSKDGVLDMTVVDPDGRVDAGDVINYTLTAKNEGNVTLSAVTIVDAMLGTLVCTPAQPATLAPGETLSCTGSYTVVQSDIDAGEVENTATVTSDKVTPPPPTTTVPLPPDPKLTPSKQGVLDMTVVAPSTRVDAGDVINYTLTAKNEGNVTLSAVTIVDAMLGTLVCTPAQPATLAPGETLSCTGSYTVVQSDIDAGEVENTATVTSDKVTPPPPTTTVPLPPDPKLTPSKQGVLDMTVVDPDGRVDAGDVINYTLTAKNEGNVTLSAVTIVDAMLGTLVCTPAQPATLAPGETLSCTGSYTVVQSDIDAGEVENTATVTSDKVTPPPPTTTVPLPPDPKLTPSKQGVLDMTVVDPDGRVDAGDVINYTLTAKNEGNVTLSAVTIVDAMLGTLVCTPAQPATLAPGETLSCTGSYTVVQSDIDAGEVENTATVTSDKVTPPPPTTTVPLPPDPSLLLDKTATESTYIVVGDQLHYSYAVTNTGNTTLAGPVTVSDDKATVTCPALTTIGDNDSVFDPGESITCTATYTIAAPDVTATQVTNHAAATAGGVDSNEDTVTVDATAPQADLAVTKTSTPNPFVAGNSLTYTVTVTNNGPQGVTGAAVTDTIPAALTSVTWTCSITTGTGACGSASGSGNAISTTVDLTNGAVATYVITGTVAGGTTGTLSNTATATTPLGTFDPNPGNNSATDTNPTNPVEADPSITITPPSTTVGIGAALPFTVTVGNNGPSAADGVKVLISIPPGYGFVSASGTNWTCGLSVNLVTCDFAGPFAASTSSAISLNLTAPGSTGSATINASVTSTTTDTNGGNNNAAANVTVTAPIPPTPTPSADLALTKTASVATATTGDRITYTLTATNNGPDTAQNVVIIDTLPTTMTFVSATGDGWSCSAAANIVTCARSSLAKGVSSPVQIVGTANIGGKAVVNAGSITSGTPDPNLSNNTATATVSITAKADLAIDKTSSSPTYVPGQKLSFTITVTNNGPDDVVGAQVRDIVPAMLQGFTWTCSSVGGRCSTANGRGAIDQLVDVTKGGSVVFNLVGTVGGTVPVQVTNRADVTPPSGTVDPDLTNNVDRVTLRRGIIPTRLRVTITPETAVVRSGIPIPAKVVTKNIGTVTAINVLTCVSLPPGITVSKAKGGFALKGRYCWRTATLARGAHVTFLFELRGDSRLAGRVRLVAQAQASNAPRVGDTSRLIVLSGKVTHEGGYTG